jgi:tRNA threonylcarbamoyl adenosine modification protein YeaZ
MKILAIEFSSQQRSVAALAGDHVLGEAMETAARATPAFELIARALADAQLEREAIECLAIGIGPGSYTGIRFAIALAQGWQLARPAVKLLGISSADCLAAEARQRGWSGRVNVAIDAQRGELYLARYEISEAGFKSVEPLKLATLEEARTRAQSGETMVGPEADRWFEGGRVLFPSAAFLGRLALQRQDFVAGDKLEPIYLRETTFVKAPPPRVLPVK